MNQLQELAEQTYNTFDEARQLVDAQIRIEGFILRIKHTNRVGNKPDGDIKALHLVCTCNGSAPLNTTARRPRVRGSCRIGCQFSVTIYRKQLENAYEWALEMDNVVHNHEPFVDPAVHPRDRALTAAYKEEILGLCRSRLPPMRVVLVMQREYNITVTPRDVYNIRDKERKNLLAGRSLIMALLDGLEASIDAPYHKQFDHERKLTHLLIVSPSANEICRELTPRTVWLIGATDVGLNYTLVGKQD